MYIEATRLETGRIRLTIDGETHVVSSSFLRALLFDATARDRVQQICNQDMRPIVGGEWWNGEGK